jgi:hypothetical protein
MDVLTTFEPVGFRNNQENLNHSQKRVAELVGREEGVRFSTSY